DLTAPLEGFMKRSLAIQQSPSSDGVALVADVASAIREVIVALERPRPQLADYSALASRVEQARQSLPEAAGSLAPSHADEVEEMLPTPVPMERPDISALPDFAGVSDGTDV